MVIAISWLRVWMRPGGMTCQQHDKAFDTFVPKLIGTFDFDYLYFE